MTPRLLVLSAIAAALLCIAGCESLRLSDNPGRDVQKGTGSPTVPLLAVRNGTAW